MLLDVAYRVRLLLVGVVGVVGVAVLGVGTVVGLAAHNTPSRTDTTPKDFHYWGQFMDIRATDCGLDKKGVYAKVEVTSPLSDAHEEPVAVDFYLNGENDPYDGTSGSVHVPAHGRASIVLHERFPSKNLHVKGRTVYMYVKTLGLPWFVTKAYHLQHPGPTAVLTVPDDANALRCSAYRTTLTD